MKGKTKNLRKLEKNRYSILTDDLTTCFICKRPKEDLHEIFEGANRQQSMKHGLVLPLCRRCHQNIHSNNQLNLQYKRIGQSKFEETHTREEFIKIFKRNYI